MSENQKNCCPDNDGNVACFRVNTVQAIRVKIDTKIGVPNLCINYKATSKGAKEGGISGCDC
jgi:hypothetical protein